MRKFLFIAAAALVVLTGCQAKSAEEIIADFQAAVGSVMAEYRTAAAKIDADAALTDVQRDEQ